MEKRSEDCRYLLCIYDTWAHDGGNDRRQMNTTNHLQPNENMPDLQDLIQRCLAGDQAAYSTLYNNVASSLYRLAYSILLDRQDAEDVVQDAMVYVFRNLRAYNPARGQFRTWLYTITVSRCRNARRRKWLPTIHLGSVLGLEPTAGDDEHPETVVARSSAHEALERALATLSPRLREAVALRYGQGLTYREMADILGCPQKTAESRIRLAHQAIRSAVTDAEAALLEEVSRL